MRDMETIRSELIALKVALSVSPGLTFDEALARISETVEKAGESAMALEEKGQTVQAEALYKALAQVFETAAQQVPEEDRQRMAALGNYWSLKVQMARGLEQSALTPEPTTEPPAQPLPGVEVGGKSPIRILPVGPYGRVDFGPDEIRILEDTGEFRLTGKIGRIGHDLKKPSELTTTIKIELPTSPQISHFEVGRARRRRLSQKKLRSGGDLGNLGSTKKGA
jgi:hypothetical protein